MEPLYGLKPAAAIILLAAFWTWETYRPFFGAGNERLRHAGRNLAIALLNAAMLGLLFSVPTVWIASRTVEARWGVLHWLGWEGGARTVGAIVLLDAWMYAWHVANHKIPFLWRFHRMHHSDNRMDVTTATRFHLGEHAISASLRWLLIPTIGAGIVELLVYDALVVAVTQLHHADISLGRADRWLRWLIVTPFIHKVHHSRIARETDSNYSSVLSVWDRLAGTLRLRSDPHAIEFGLADYDDPRWQTIRGMLATPLRERTAPARAVEDGAEEDGRAS